MDVTMNVTDRFSRDVMEWRADSHLMSSVTDMVLLPSYQRIIGLGPAAVPLLIEDLRRDLSDGGDPDHWFWALTAIVGEDHAAGAHTTLEAARRWVEWFDNKETPWPPSQN
jgi:hypothetical protein